MFAIALGMASAGKNGGSSPKAVTVAPNLAVDPNRVPVQVLEAMPAVGPAMAGRFVAARELRPISSLEDARRRVRGLGPATVARLGPHLRFEPQDLPATSEIATIVVDRSRSE
jgi:DNA uptake protein ComE-like DNA-binding protein